MNNTRLYIAFLLIVIGCFTYATWNGITFWEDKAERNTEYNSSGRVPGAGMRFYHK